MIKYDPKNPPKEKLVVYKYMSSTHLDAFLTRGAIRVGSLYDFRRQEKYGPEIGDREEGILHHKENIPDQQIPFLGHNQFLNVGGMLFENGSNLSIQGVSSVKSIICPDAYVYCVSKTAPTKEVMAQLDRDACVQISDFHTFAYLLNGYSFTAGHTLGRYVTQSCKYNGRDTNEAVYSWFDPRSGYFQKEPKHTYQNESRVVMPPAEGCTVVPYFDIECPAITQLFRDVTP